ncbi:ATP-binding domain-containing protein [Rheinheimera sp. MM224]|uniref:ATP-binding domain-containing protein n=1 Tax=Rheinheimera sp. MM224 TaxID=3019969 RepID=UPI0021F82A7C|nr:ATP-binding domain-containing protein [Rheinheimera sp. MM224]CAI3798153.1 hypothetical protein JAMGFMIE_02000 [Rheinheimera sp. MM224]
MPEINYSQFADKTIKALTAVADFARSKLTHIPGNPADCFALLNTANSTRAIQDVTVARDLVRKSLGKLLQEPFVVYLVVEDAEGQSHELYITRSTPPQLNSGRMFASYQTEIGKLAEIPVGDGREVEFKGERQYVRVLQKAGLRPIERAASWDSQTTRFIYPAQKIDILFDSLLPLLVEAHFEEVDDLDALLAQPHPLENQTTGYKHEALVAMELRDQPILDQFQGEIFRLPLDSQLLILGPPGTGKTTTLIKRLAQKTNILSLDASESELFDDEAALSKQRSSWMMFSPSDLLKQYLKEAFNREQIPASDENIRTWSNHRDRLARESLRILKTTNGGKFILRNGLTFLKPGVDIPQWYTAFADFHQLSIKNQLSEGYQTALRLGNADDIATFESLEMFFDAESTYSLLDLLIAVEQKEDKIKALLDKGKETTDQLIKQERDRVFKLDRTIFERLGTHLRTLTQDQINDDEDEFEGDESDVAEQTNDLKLGVAAFVGSLRSIAKNVYLKKSILKTGRTAEVIAFIQDKLPENDVLQQLGKEFVFQSALRRLSNAHRRFVEDVSTSYQRFRRDKNFKDLFYVDEVISATDISFPELDAIILLTLQNARQLMHQAVIKRKILEVKFDYLTGIRSLFKNQIMVDEATDFSGLELACMEALTSLDTKSFFACGDFNQRITTKGLRSEQDFSWLMPRLEMRRINCVYRQSKKLNDFSHQLIQLQSGDLTTLGTLPTYKVHEGVAPLLMEYAEDLNTNAQWLAERIREIDNGVNQIPTIAVLVNQEAQVIPMAELLTQHLEDINLKAAACSNGKILGEGNEIRVFDIQHIKGLEFEAVFFVGLDELAEQKPDLYERFLYVGATRAATYLGLSCIKQLPSKLEPLRAVFVRDWSDNA